MQQERSEAQYKLDHATGRFLPANQAAWDECNAFNAWAAQVNARTRAQEGRSDARINR